LDFSTISHAHAETVLRGIAYCRFRFDVRLGLVLASRAGFGRKANDKRLKSSRTGQAGR
jgi:hypothetical protein